LADGGRPAFLDPPLSAAGEDEHVQETLSPDDPRVTKAFSENLRTMGAGIYLYAGSHRLFDQLTSASFVRYTQGIVQDAGDPSDPLERLLVEQLIQISHAASRLLVKASLVGSAEGSALLHATAARLFGEYRKGLLALREYRTSVASGGPQVRAVGTVEQPDVTTGSRDLSLVRDSEQGAA
jgi:hypothetical protein